MTSELLVLRGVHKRLGGRAVLASVELRCGRGEVVQVRGGNGAGKSTLLRVVAGILEPDQGEVHVAGGLGYVPDGSDALPDLLVSEFIGLVAALKRTGPPPAALRERLGVQPLWGQRMGALSFGQRKRTCLLAALTGGPGLLVLDEPSNGLDPDGVALVLQILREQRERGAVLLSTNDDAFSGEAGGIVYVLTAGGGCCRKVPEPRNEDP